MKLTFSPYTLELKHTFTISTYSRDSTPGVQVRLRHEGITGYGEAAMPQYLGETVESVMSFLSKADMSQFNDPMMTEDILSYVDHLAPGNCAAKAAIDIALHDLIGKMMDIPCHRLFGLDKSKAPETSYTIGIASPQETTQKVKEASRDNNDEFFRKIRMFVNSNTGSRPQYPVMTGETDRYKITDIIR